MPSIRTVLDGVLGAAQIIGCVAFSPLLRRWYSRWGCRGLIDTKRAFAGDELVPAPKSSLTCALAVDTPPARIWPWLVQLGCGRAGWYSYDLLDNGGRESASRILPECQSLKVGDVVPAVPNGSFGFPVAALQPGSALILAGTINTRTGLSAKPDELGDDPYFSGGQSFLIEPVSKTRSVLIFRMRIDWNRSRLNTVIYRYVLEPISFVMGRKMLLNLKRRAELPASSSPASPQRL